MESLVIAVATDDGVNLIDRHFGDAESYSIYALSPDGYKLIKRIENNTEEERMHADPVKAKGVTGMLKEQKVQVALSKVFGPNIKRITKKFVCVVAGVGTVEEGMKKLKTIYDDLCSQWEAGEERKIIKL